MFGSFHTSFNSSTFDSTFLSRSNELGSYRHFLCRYWNSFSGYIFGYSTHFIKYSTSYNNSYPIFGDPFPKPIRVSVGLSVTGLSGNIRTYIFPPRRAFRVIVLRPTSICLDVIQAGSNPWIAYLPKQIRLPR